MCIFFFIHFTCSLFTFSRNFFLISFSFFVLFFSPSLGLTQKNMLRHTFSLSKSFRHNLYLASFSSPIAASNFLRYNTTQAPINPFLTNRPKKNVKVLRIDSSKVFSQVKDLKGKNNILLDCLYLVEEYDQDLRRQYATFTEKLAAKKAERAKKSGNITPPTEK